MTDFINMTVKHNNNILNLNTECFYVSSFGLHVSVNCMTIIRSIKAKIYDMQQSCMSYILALMDLMMVINLTETCSPNELTLKSYMSYT